MPDIASKATHEFFKDYLITEYLSKYKGLKTSFNTRDRALGKWKQAEVQCAETNLRFRQWQHRPFSGRVECALFGAQRKIAAVLGELRIPVVLDGCKWGPGATFDLIRSEASPDKKMLGPISVTDSALPWFKTVVEADPHWGACFFGVIPEGAYSLLPSAFKTVRGSRFLTVPKTAKIDRCIAAEPTGNSFLQQGVHSYLRRRLRRFGVNLDDQSINQRRAHDAFFCGLSTLDLSMASDTISRELIYHLLPLDWALFLDSLCSRETLVDGEWVRTHKFASMGNAFCFELESLVFWALAGSVNEDLGNVDSVTVYGDDIIVPRDSFDRVVEILTECGFTINTKKSFKDGNFFESCGKHYHMGTEVTPVYQKEVVIHPSELIRAHNRLCRLAIRSFNGELVVVRKAMRAITEMWPHRPFPRIPYGLQEDGGFLRPLREFIPHQNHGFRCHVYDFEPRYTGAREDAMYAYQLRRTTHLNDGRKEAVRESTYYSVFERRHRSFFNPEKILCAEKCPDGRRRHQTGYVGVAVMGKWRTKVRDIYESAISESEWLEPPVDE
jgi:hypothetical protein